MPQHDDEEVILRGEPFGRQHFVERAVFYRKSRFLQRKNASAGISLFFIVIDDSHRRPGNTVANLIMSGVLHIIRAVQESLGLAAMPVVQPAAAIFTSITAAKQQPDEYEKHQLHKTIF